MRSVYRNLLTGLLIIALAAAACPLFGSQEVSAVEPTKENQASAQNDLYAVWGSSGSDVFAVGQDGTILHYNGLAWTAMNSSTTDDLYAVWGTADDDVFAVGQDGTVLHYDGVAWSSMLRGTTYDLSSVWGASNTDTYAVGQRGTILYYNETAWDSTTLDSTFSGVWTSLVSGVRQLYGVWGTSDDAVFAVGQDGTTLYYNRSTALNDSATSRSLCETMPSGTDNDLYAIWGASATDVFAVGQSGTILYYNGSIMRPGTSMWLPMTSGTNASLYDIWGWSSSSILAVGQDGVVEYYDGSTWQSIRSYTTASLYGIWGDSVSDIFVVGQGGTILYCDGFTWATMAGGASTTPAAAPEITAVSLAAGEVGVPYSQTLDASAGTLPYTWSIANGSLPSGLSLDSSGIISGTPSATGKAGFTVMVSDGKGSSATRSLSIIITAKPTPTTTDETTPEKNGGASAWTWSGMALVLLLAIAITARIVINKRRQKRHGVQNKK